MVFNNNGFQMTRVWYGVKNFYTIFYYIPIVGCYSYTAKYHGQP